MSAIRSQLVPWVWPQTTAKPSPVAEEVSQLFEEFRGAVLRYILSLGLPMQDAEDILQEVFLSLFHHLSKDKPRDNLRGWVFRVGHNLALKRRQSLKPADALPESLLMDPGMNPEEEVAARRERERMLKIVAALPERDRCCLLLRAEGLRYREIAATLNLSLGTVSATLARALSRLQVEPR
ncbi:MAG: sigma-70 family RNA polymerase sigma factor [Acidobacteria bacterium]|nr:sigma-70 family RNA polymerase sigma factor [Acidobacteriota bacterium]